MRELADGAGGTTKRWENFLNVVFLFIGGVQIVPKGQRTPGTKLFFVENSTSIIQKFGNNFGQYFVC